MRLDARLAGAAPRQALAIEQREIDRIDQQRREAAIACCLGDHLPGKRKKHARALDHHHRRRLLLRHIGEPEHARIDQFHREQGAVALGGTGLLIVVSVVVETMKQIEAQLMMRNYEGFIR